jgi:uncharacterized membrane protein YqjE
MTALGEPAITQVLSDIVGNVQHIMRAELRLAKAELKEDTAMMKRAAVLAAAGAVSGSVALAFLCLAAVYALATAVPPWAAALIVALVVAAVAGLCMLAAGRQVRGLGLPRTAATVQENVQWIKRRAG